MYLSYILPTTSGICNLITCNQRGHSHQALYIIVCKCGHTNAHQLPIERARKERGKTTARSLVRLECTLTRKKKMKSVRNSHIAVAPP